MFLTQLIFGMFMVGWTVFVHAVVLDRLVVFLERFGPVLYKKSKIFWKSNMLMITVLGVFLAHIVQIWGWAFLYLAGGAISTFEEALYFSTTTFTTLGLGDIALDKTWRLLSSFQSANGFMLFGWSTAFIFEVMSKLYKDDVIRKTEKRESKSKRGQK